MSVWHTPHVITIYFRIFHVELRTPGNICHGRFQLAVGVCLTDLFIFQRPLLSRIVSGTPWMLRFFHQQLGTVVCIIYLLDIYFILYTQCRYSDLLISHYPYPKGCNLAFIYLALIVVLLLQVIIIYQHISISCLVYIISLLLLFCTNIYSFIIFLFIQLFSIHTFRRKIAYWYCKTLMHLLSWGTWVITYPSPGCCHYNRLSSHY